MLDEIEAERESVLVFTQFTEIGKSLEALFRRRYGGPVYYLHGGTPRARREHMVEEFQDPDTEPAIFVLSLRAGGTGITLTRANHVIHFDRWWNPRSRIRPPTVPTASGSATAYSSTRW